MGIDIPPGAIIKSSKSVLCGEMGEILTNINKRFGEIPFMSGEERLMCILSAGKMYKGKDKKGT